LSIWYTHVNRGVIDSNRKNGTNNPPVRFQKGKYGKSTYAHEVEFPAGGRVIYDHEGTILPCGARLVIASEHEPKVVR
jgi:hypothetical protein